MCVYNPVKMNTLVVFNFCINYCMYFYGLTYKYVSDLLIWIAKTNISHLELEHSEHVP